MPSQANLLSRLGPAIRWLRDRQARKQYQVADSAGITKGMLSAYETGRQRPSLETLEKILGTLGCDLHDLHDALRIVNGDTREPAPAPSSWPGFAYPARPQAPLGTSSVDPSLIYGVLGVDSPLDPEEEAAMTQMLGGFHRLLRHFHRSFQKGSPGQPGPAGSSGAQGSNGSFDPADS